MARTAPVALALSYLLVLCAPASPQELVSFSTSDGGVVYADEYGAGDRSVILAPGGRFDRKSWHDQALRLADAGFRVLSLDFRGRGRSRGPEGRNREEGYPLDVLAAVRHLRTTGAKTVSVVGASLGGWAAAEASIRADPGQIDALVLLAASPVEEPERLQGRKLFITARDDTTGSGTRRLTWIERQYEAAPEPKELVIVEGAAHAQLLFGTDQGELVMAETLRFLGAQECPGVGALPYREASATRPAPTFARAVDAAVAAMPLPSLRTVSLPSDRRELRLWVGFGFLIPHRMLRLTDSPRGADGQLFAWWDLVPEISDSVSTDFLVERRRRAGACGCDRRGNSWACQRDFERPPPWPELLRRAEELRAFSLPDPDSLEPSGLMVFDGISLMVEALEGDRYRTYMYSNPHRQPWPEAELADGLIDLVLRTVTDERGGTSNASSGH